MKMRNPGLDKGYSTWSDDTSQNVGVQWRLDQAGEDDFGKLDNDELFEKLKDWDSKGYIMGAAAKVKAKGILGGHAYTILKLVEVEEEDMKMVQIRNPHGGNEWTGKFNDADDDNWNDHPATMEACGHTVGECEDGQFWMRLKDFCRHFSSCCVSFQACVDQDGNPMPRFDEIEEGHEFTGFEIDVEGHEWDDDDEVEPDDPIPDDVESDSDDELSDEEDEDTVGGAEGCTVKSTPTARFINS